MAKAAKSKPAQPQPYHHGDLRRALLDAAEAIVDVDGSEVLTLRNCAKAAGVSHTAPRHHVGDLRGLLTALATRFWAELADAMDQIAATTPAPRDRLQLQGEAYISYVTRFPARYRLMLRRECLDDSNEALLQAWHRPGQHLRANIAALIGTEPAVEQLLLAWATVHGLAELIVNGQCGPTCIGPGAIDRPERVIERLIGLEETDAESRKPAR
mgnify:CR=1 FL=1